MRIFNVMMCRDLGGIQQAFLDYEQALLMAGYEVINITSVNAEIHKLMQKPSYKLPNLTSWCPISKIYLRILISCLAPDAIIVHGGRASNFACSLKVTGVPVVGITHNYSYKRLKKCDYIIALTQDLQKHLVDDGYPEKQIYFLPNMINVDVPYVQKGYHEPIVIGTYGRFVKNKGFQHLISALRQVLDKGFNVKLIIGGYGEENDSLRLLVQNLSLENYVDFIGWVDSKSHFFESIDIFCCPSEHEPFGIVVLESMKYSTPIIATKSQGPSEILDHKNTALLSDNYSVDDIANKVIDLIQNQTLAHDLARNAYQKVKTVYDSKVISEGLSEVMQSVCQKSKL